MKKILKDQQNKRFKSAEITGISYKAPLDLKQGRLLEGLRPLKITNYI